MASNADNSYQANLSCVNDQVCISLDHNIKVHFKLDDSIMVKDYSRNSCISVAGTKVLPITTRLFSIHRDGVKVHHNSSDTLMIEFINEYDQAINNHYPQVVPLARSGIISLSVEPEFFGFNQMIGCEDVFHQQVVDFNDDREVKTRLLADNMIIVKRDNGEISYRFSNGIEINKCPTGVIKVYSFKIKCEIMMGPCGTSLISIGNTRVVSCENNFHVIKGSSNVKSINGVIHQFIAPKSS